MEPKNLNDNIIYLAGEFSREFGQTMTRRFQEAGHEISAEQFGVLAVLWYQEGITQSELSESLGRDKTTISRVVDTMIKRNLLKRTVSENDRRVRQLYLTEKGRNLQNDLITLSGEMYMSSLEGIPESSVRIAIYVLSRMRQNIN